VPVSAGKGRRTRHFLGIGLFLSIRNPAGTGSRSMMKTWLSIAVLLW